MMFVPPSGVKEVSALTAFGRAKNAIVDQPRDSGIPAPRNPREDSFSFRLRPGTMNAQISYRQMEQDRKRPMTNESLIFRSTGEATPATLLSAIRPTLTRP